MIGQLWEFRDRSFLMGKGGTGGIWQVAPIMMTPPPKKIKKETKGKAKKERQREKTKKKWQMTNWVLSLFPNETFSLVHVCFYNFFVLYSVVELSFGA